MLVFKHIQNRFHFSKTKDFKFQKKCCNFWTCHFALRNSRESKTTPLDIPHSCKVWLGNSKAKKQDQWKFHMIFSWSLLKISLLFQLTSWISILSFFNTPRKFNVLNPHMMPHKFGFTSGKIDSNWNNLLSIITAPDKNWCTWWKLVEWAHTSYQMKRST